MRKTTIIAHRGASGHAPENTLAAFQKAAGMKVDAVECDVQRCRSGQLVVFHDRDLKRITGKRGKVKKKKLAELRKLDAGNGERIPTLKEVLELVDARTGINIEMKSRGSAVPLAQMIRNSIRTDSWKAEDFFVSSFYYRPLRRFHELIPEIPIALLYNKKPKRLKKRIKVLRPFAASLNAKHIRPAWISRVHDHGLKAYVWTVDDVRVAEQLQQERVDGFFTNYPGRFLK
ncbi:MAG: glycerophosphodiester phosphodiesterase [Candidatus Marinimicrobia bacterium]|nr:glycerophosphodiester phosphodiesterase [Candidatus Neomarinimicrobiota bacterium]